MCDRLREAGHGGAIQQLTGLILDPYFSATKIAWILDNVAGARAQAEAGRLICGTVDTWLIWKLTGNKKIHVTDPTTHPGQCCSTSILAWDPACLKFSASRKACCRRCALRAKCMAKSMLSRASRISRWLARRVISKPLFLGKCACGPDWQKILTAQAVSCYRISARTGRIHPTPPHHGICKIGEKQEFALEGSVFVGGAVVQWLRDGLRVVRSAQEVDMLAASVPDSGGVVLVPAFTGLGAPHWDPYARDAHRLNA